MDKDLAQKCISMEQDGNWDGAFSIIFDGLATEPEDQIVRTLLWSALAMYENIPKHILLDLRLEAFWWHCEKCAFTCIPETAAMKFAGFSVELGGTVNPIIIQCKTCEGIFCRKCYQTEGISIVCPKCGSKDTDISMKPNGSGRRYVNKQIANNKIPKVKTKCKCGHSFMLNQDNVKELSDLDAAICIREKIKPSEHKTVICPNCQMKILLKIARA